MQTGKIMTSIGVRLRAWKKWMFILLGIGAICGVGIYLIMVLVTHSPLRGDRIVILSHDNRYAFILEAYRTRVLGLMTYHGYTLLSLHDGITASEKMEFTSFADDDIMPHGSLRAFTRSDAYEMAHVQVAGTVDFPGYNEISFSSALLQGDYVTKTNPEYFRYMSVGEGEIRIGDAILPAHILIDTTLASDGSASQLAEGTHVRGKLGGFWDTDGDFRYFDMTSIDSLAKGDNYTSHQYLLTKSHDGMLKRYDDYTLEPTGNGYYALEASDLSMTLGPIVSIPPDDHYDIYSFTSNDENHGFMNLYRN